MSRLVYISCNAESMAEDLAKLGTSTEAGHPRGGRLEGKGMKRGQRAT